MTTEETVTWALLAKSAGLLEQSLKLRPEILEPHNSYKANCEALLR
jgi:hypothetical protein